ncbi:MAG: 50S ribosomal protein L24 [Candidatus Omnitrophica bacterium]|nr:50S ribosomal protein L24 [Candidatus Omnitrophota bacterium]HOX54727.1 50S ribosomal protein L24 [Candidatus Omnitrophota bacterium]
MLKIRKDDTVLVIAGKDRGKKGKVLHVFPKINRALVERVNMMKKHVRKRREQDQAGILEMESPINVSNLMVVCKHCSKPTRVGFKLLKDNTKTRTCKKCGEAI